MGDCALRLQDVRWSPASHDGRTRGPAILRDVSLRAPRGEVTFVLGNSGGGKSTLLRLCNRLIDPDDGRVEVLGKDTRDWNVRALRSQAVYVPQRPTCFGDDLAEDLGAAPHWLGRTIGQERLQRALEVAQLDLPLSHPTRGLSEGQKARLGLARALVLDPPLLLLDEPTAALDVRTSRHLMAALGEWLRRSRGTLVCVTHRIHELALLPGRAVVLLDGHVAGEYSSEQILTRDTSPPITAFLGELEAGS